MKIRISLTCLVRLMPILAVGCVVSGCGGSGEASWEDVDPAILASKGYNLEGLPGNSVAGVWIVTRANVPENGTMGLRKYSGKRVSISRKDDYTYEMNWLDDIPQAKGGGGSFSTNIYHGNRSRIALTEQCNLLDNYFKDQSLPDFVRNQLSGQVATRTETYSLSNSGRQIDVSQNAPLVTWYNNGTVLRTDLPGYYKMVLIRISGTPAPPGK